MSAISARILDLSFELQVDVSALKMYKFESLSRDLGKDFAFKVEASSFL